MPEAFNDCWENADFAATGMKTQTTFIPHPGGSGSMLKSVLEGHVDAAFALTDCIVAAIENGSPVRIAAPLVQSPLTWAIIVSPHSHVKTVQDLSAATWGVSRMGSGSHVMVQFLAKQRGWSTPPQFAICKDFQGLRNAVTSGTVDAFLWEHYTTRPYEESGEVSIIGGVPTPWGCFSVMVRSECPQIEDIRKIIDAFLQAGDIFLKDPASVALVARKYGMNEADARAWIKGVRYASVGERKVPSEVLELTRQSLLNAGVIKEITFKDGVESYHI